MAAPRYALPIFLLLMLAAAGLFAWMVIDDLKGRELLHWRPATTKPVVDPSSDGHKGIEGGAVRTPKTSDATDGSESAATAPAAPDGPPLFPAQRRSADWSAVVEDELGRGVAAVDVELDSVLGGFTPGLEIADDRGVHAHLRSDPEGRVRRAGLMEGAYRLRARAPDGRATSLVFAFRVDDSRTPLSIDLNDALVRPPGVAIAVVDRDGAPIADATVELFSDATRPPLAAKCDARGRARFAGVDWHEGIALAHAPDGRAGSIKLQDGDGEADAELSVAATIVVEPAGRIAGEFVDGGGVAAEVIERALRGATVDAYASTTQMPWGWSFGRSEAAPVVARRFDFAGQPAGEYAFVLHAPGGARLLLQRFAFGEPLENSVTPPTVFVTSGETERVALTVVLGATISGRVHFADGSPIANASVTAVFAPRAPNAPEGLVLHGTNVWRFDSDGGFAADHPLTHVRVRSDATGAYTLAGLQPGVQRVIVAAPGLCFDRREAVVVADGQTTLLDHTLEPAGALQGIAPSNDCLGITRAGDAQPTAIAILSGNCTFTFGALRPGGYSIAQFHREGSIAPVEIAHATVVAGRTTFVDLSDAPGPIEVSGQVVDANGPLLDAEVVLDTTIRHVDDAGRFVFHRFLPFTGEFNLCVRARRVAFQFTCDPAPFDNAGWHGVLRLGDGTLRIECRDVRGGTVAGDVEFGSDPDQATTPRNLIFSRRLALDGLGACTIDRVLPGHYSVELHAQNGADVRVAVDLPRSDVLQIVAPDCGTVDVTLFDAGGCPLPDWQVTAASYLRDGEIPDDVEGHDEWFRWIRAPTDSHGRARLGGVSAGKVIVSAVDIDETTPGNAAPTPQRIELRANGVKSVELRTPPSRDD